MKENAEVPPKCHTKYRKIFLSVRKYSDVHLPLPLDTQVHAGFESQQLFCINPLLNKQEVSTEIYTSEFYRVLRFAA